jgi:hypothetical protein
MRKVCTAYAVKVFTMKNKIKRMRIASAMLIATVGAPLHGAIIINGNHTTITLTSAEAYGSAAPADTTFLAGAGQIYGSHVVEAEVLSRITELFLRIDYNFDGDFADPGDVNVDFTGGGVMTPGTSPTFTAYAGPGINNPLGSGVQIVGGGPLRTFIISNHEVGVGGQEFRVRWEGVLTAEVGGANTPFQIDVTNTIPEPNIAIMAMLGAPFIFMRRR